MRFVTYLNVCQTWDVLDTKNLIICPFNYRMMVDAEAVARDFNEGSDNPANYGWDNPDGTDAKFVD